MMVASSMDLHGIQNMCLHSRILHKSYLCSTRYTPEKSLGLYDFKADILKLVYAHLRRFIWAFRARGEFQGLCLWYIVKEWQYLLLKRQNDKKTGRVSATIPLSASHSPLSNSCLTDQIALREKENHKMLLLCSRGGKGWLPNY